MTLRSDDSLSILHLEFQECAFTTNLRTTLATAQMGLAAYASAAGQASQPH